ncbi:MAG: hypothetical protein U9O50_05650 [Acidobacteriota bacterium]|nr:hypothetical protein [Acidobacteriota bacterium]
MSKKRKSNSESKIETYPQSLNEGTLNKKAINNLREFMKDKGMSVEELPDEILKQTGYRPKIEYWVCRGNQNWEGLVVGFPGTKNDLSTRNVGTPFLRKLLYPMLILHRSLRHYYSRPMPCLYLIGDCFNDVFLRKFRFLSSLVPHVIVLSGDLQRWVYRKAGHKPTKKADKINEYYLQKFLCDRMDPEKGLRFPISSGKSIRVDLISYEVPTVAGTLKTERLDILGYDLDDHSLVAFEIKGSDADRPELENLFFQGLEHRNWLEENKMAVKFAIDGPRGKRINTRKRVKLILGFCKEKIPELFLDLKTQALRRDRFLQLEFCRLIPPLKYGGDVKVERFKE